MARLSDSDMAVHQPTVVERQLQVALDNMPGALVYTDDDLSIIFCNDRFKEMYQVPTELLQSGRSYPAFLRYLAEHGYYGEGDIDALVARRVESLRASTVRSSLITSCGSAWTARDSSLVCAARAFSVWPPGGFFAAPGGRGPA